MPFNSLSFLCFFLVFVSIYYSVAHQQAKLVILLAGSYVFYTYGNLFNLLCLLVITLVTYYFASSLRRRPNKIVLATGIILILAILITTKYSRSITRHFHLEIASENAFFNSFILPIGISFYSLQAISLLVDIYRVNCIPDLTWRTLFLYLSFFPQAVAGPIHRANELIPQFVRQKRFESVNFVLGTKIMLWGYFCKLIVADKIALVVDPVFDTYSKQDGLSLVIASFLYSLQIYFDFWGYSLIAIGVGTVLGYVINRNFVSPYAATSFRDFWHRWHITLSRWMRDYVYLPLGGRSKKSYVSFCVAILVTFLVSGFWHGVSLNFILWGITHAALYLAEDGIRQKVKGDSLSKETHEKRLLFRALWFILFFSLLSFTWLLFRTENMGDLQTILIRIGNVKGWSTRCVEANYLTVANGSYLFLALSALLFSRSKIVFYFTTVVANDRRGIVRDSLVMIVCLILLILLGDIGGQEFLYFNF